MLLIYIVIQCSFVHSPRINNSRWWPYNCSRAAGVKDDIDRYMKKYEQRQRIELEKEEQRRKNKELQDAQIALQDALKKWLTEKYYTWVIYKNS